MKLLKKITEIGKKIIPTNKSLCKTESDFKGKMFLVFGLSTSFLFGKDIEGLMGEIFKFLEGGVAKSIAGIIFVGLGIYVLRNMERWKEILLNVIAIVVGLLLVLNAKKIAELFF